MNRKVPGVRIPPPLQVKTLTFVRVFSFLNKRETKFQTRSEETKNANEVSRTLLDNLLLRDHPDSYRDNPSSLPTHGFGRQALQTKPYCVSVRYSFIRSLMDYTIQNQKYHPKWMFFTSMIRTYLSIKINQGVYGRFSKMFILKNIHSLGMSWHYSFSKLMQQRG